MRFFKKYLESLALILILWILLIILYLYLVFPYNHIMLIIVRLLSIWINFDKVKFTYIFKFSHIFWNCKWPFIFSQIISIIVSPYFISNDTAKFVIILILNFWICIWILSLIFYKYLLINFYFIKLDRTMSILWRMRLLLINFLI